MPGMNCETFGHFLGCWLDGKVDGSTRVALQAHSMLCPDCRQLHATRESLRRIVDASNADEGVPTFIANIIANTSSARRGT